MHMLDVYVPEGVLPAEVETQLLAGLQEILIEHEGADPTDPEPGHWPRCCFIDRRQCCIR